MRGVRRWICWRLLHLALWVHPGAHVAAGHKWQVVSVPRRISETEAEQLSDMVRAL